MKKILFTILMSGLILTSFNFALAVDPGTATDPSTTGKTEGGGTQAELKNPLGDNVTVADVVNRLVKGALGMVGVLALVAFIWGGIDWMTSGGNEARIKKGKTMMIWAALGIIVIFGSYAILNLIFKSLGA